jgi:SAM-dependent methyltransferase
VSGGGTAVGAPNHDTWLDRHAAMLAGRSIFEIGCGGGRDTATLVKCGGRVIAVDVSSAAIERARVVAPAAEFHCQDLRAPWPTSVAGVEAVVASLSLHYFAWAETVAVVDRIAMALTAGGVLLCRVNSVNDVHHGARGHPEIEQNYYSVDGRPKRFFDRAAVDALFSEGWNLRDVEERTVMRYTHPKVLWEIIATRVRSDG